MRWIFPILLLAVASAQSPVAAVLQSTEKQTTQTHHYDPAYVRIPYPNGDVPLERGVCSDVVIRGLRAAGVDLQKEVHQDMKRAFDKYPRIWRLRAPDSNIDHRRVANLMTFFTRRGKALPITTVGADYRAGDIVAWRLDNGLLHIGIVVAGENAAKPMAVHNIGSGARKEDVLFRWKIIGHYRWFE